MTDIHPKTLLIALAIEFISLTLVTLPAWRTWPMRSGMARWSMGNAALALSMGLLSQRGEAPGILTVVVANALLIYGAHSVHVAVRMLYEAPPMRTWQRVPPFLAWLALALFWFFDDSPGAVASANWRVGAYATALAWSAGGTSFALFRRAPRPWSLGTWYVFVAMLMPLSGQIVRFVARGGQPRMGDPVIAPTTAVPLYASFAACGVFMTYGFFLLINNRLQEQLRDANARLQEDAATDPLTGVANRRHLETIAATEISRAHRYGWPMTVMMLDLDHFKHVNDRYGHAAGDEVLQTVARVFQRQLRGHDLVARIGGEEFAILLPHSDILGAEVSARRLLQEVRDTAMEVLDGGSVTVSIGIAALAEGETGIASLLSRADAALYRAKSAGRDRVAVDEPVAT